MGLQGSGLGLGTGLGLQGSGLGLGGGGCVQFYSYSENYCWPKMIKLMRHLYFNFEKVLLTKSKTEQYCCIGTILLFDYKVEWKLKQDLN